MRWPLGPFQDQRIRQLETKEQKDHLPYLL